GRFVVGGNWYVSLSPGLTGGQTFPVSVGPASGPLLVEVPLEVVPLDVPPPAPLEVVPLDVPSPALLQPQDAIARVVTAASDDVRIRRRGAIRLSVSLQRQRRRR